MSEWRPDLRDEEDPVRSALELGLRQQPLDAAALARVRESVRAEFDTMHGWRAGSRRWPRWVAAMAATLAGLTVLAALYLFQGEEGPPFGNVVRIERGSLRTARNFFRTHDLGVGADVPSQEAIMSAGTSLIALAGGGLLRVAPGASFEGVGSNEVVLRAGRVFLDFPRGAGRFVLSTSAGTFEHIGTQFEAVVEGGSTRIRVREGAVRMSTPAAAAALMVDAGTEVVVSQAGSVARRSVPTYGPDWAWAESTAPQFEIENRELMDFLGWVARETGRHVEFVDERARDVAGHTLLHGSVRGLAPLAALQQVLSTTSLRYEIHDDVIRVSSAR
ncbi:MAG: FecR domain-containing protein [Gammaproteobacteria bacterium]